MLGTIMTRSITFFATQERADELVLANGGEAEGFRVKPAVGREGKFIIEVFDTDDGYILGTL